MISGGFIVRVYNQFYQIKSIANVSLMRRWSGPYIGSRIRHSCQKALLPIRALRTSSRHHVHPHGRVQVLLSISPAWPAKELQSGAAGNVRPEQSGIQAYSQQAAKSRDSFQQILSEASAFQIDDLASLQFESTFTPTQGQDCTSRLIEVPQHKFDYDLWDILLRYRMLSHGDEGIKSAWNRLADPHSIHEIPAHWIFEDRLWTAFVGLGIRDRDFLKRIAAHVKQLWNVRGLRRSALYVEVVGGILEGGEPAFAPEFSLIMHPGALVTGKELLSLFQKACSSSDQDALHHFRTICDSIPNHRIYGAVISEICDQRRAEEALTMHHYLICHNDYPTCVEEVEPLIRQTYHLNVDVSALILQLEDHGIHFGNRIRSLFASLRRSRMGITGEDLDHVTMKTFGVKRSKISDSFAARFFATKSLSFETALNVLQFLGLQSLGPLSLREIALHSDSIPVFRQRVRATEKAGIDTGASAYSEVIRRLLRRGPDSLLTDVIKCDQHPDVFDNQQIQVQLLQTYHESKDWRQVNRTFAILDTFGDSKAHVDNALLRSAILRQSWPTVNSIVSQMHQQGGSVSKANIINMFKVILAHRPTTGTRKALKKDSANLLFLINLWQKSFKSSANISPDLWREPLRRLVIMHKWDDVAKLCQWLCSSYGPSKAPKSYRDPQLELSIFPSEHDNQVLGSQSDLNEIFSPALQRAVVELGFLVHPSSQYPMFDAREVSPAWACGLELLCHLREGFGVVLDDLVIKSACEVRLRRLLPPNTRCKGVNMCSDGAQTKPEIEICVDLINRIYGADILDLQRIQLLASTPVQPRISGDRLGKAKIQDAKEESYYGSRKSKVANHGEVESDEKPDEFMMYRDLFHASWEDYEPRRADLLQNSRLRVPRQIREVKTNT